MNPAPFERLIEGALHSRFRRVDDAYAVNLFNAALPDAPDEARHLLILSLSRSRWEAVISLLSRTPRSAWQGQRVRAAEATAAAATGPARDHARLRQARRSVGSRRGNNAARDAGSQSWSLVLRSAIKAPTPIPPDFPDLAQQLHRVIPEPHGGVGIVIPGNRHFLHSITAPLGDEQKLHIKADSIHPLHGERGLPPRFHGTS